MSGGGVRQKIELGLGALALLLTGVNVAMAESNRDIQTRITERQALVAKAQTLASLNNNLIQLLARGAADQHDDALRNLLARNGVNFTQAPHQAEPLVPADNGAGAVTP